MIGATTACTDLDVDINSKYVTYPTSEAATNALMADVYYQFRGALGRRYMEAMALSSDEWVSISFDGDYYDVPMLMLVHTCSVTQMQVLAGMAIWLLV